MTAAGNPEPERMIGPSVNGVGVPIEGAECPAGWDGQGSGSEVSLSSQTRCWVPWLLMGYMGGCGSLLRLIRPSSAWWHPAPGRAIPGRSTRFRGRVPAGIEGLAREAGSCKSYRATAHAVGWG